MDGCQYRTTKHKENNQGYTTIIVLTKMWPIKTNDKGVEDMDVEESLKVEDDDNEKGLGIGLGMNGS